MDFSYLAAISASGMNVAQARLNAAAINIANVHTTRTPEGGPYRPLRVVSAFSNNISSFSKEETPFRNVPGAQVIELINVDVPPRMAFEPKHPDADERGFVAFPGIDSTLEMVNLMTAVRSYEANVIAINSAKAMTLKALEIGSNS